MRLAIIVVGIAMGISGSAFAGQSNEQAAASTAAVAQAPAVPCAAPETADPAINEKGHGTAGRTAMSSERVEPLTANHAINTKGTGGNRMAINTKGTGCNNGKVAPNKHPTGAY